MFCKMSDKQRCLHSPITFKYALVTSDTSLLLRDAIANNEYFNNHITGIYVQVIIKLL